MRQKNLKERQKDLQEVVSDIVKFLVKIERSKGAEKRRFQTKLRYSVKQFLELLPKVKSRNLFVYYLFCFAHDEFEKFHRYFEALYFSKDYYFYKSLRPIDVARYARYYLGRRNIWSDLKFLPALIKHARLVKNRIRERMRYQMKLNPFIGWEEAFELVKKNYEEKRKVPKLGVKIKDLAIISKREKELIELGFKRYLLEQYRRAQKRAQKKKS